MIARPPAHRQIVATVTTAAAGLRVASHSDVLVTTTAIVSRPLVETFALVSRPLPVEFPTVPINCNWHQRYDSDAAHGWLRDQVRASVAELCAP